VVATAMDSITIVAPR